MVPKPVHIHVARACLRHGKHMLTTAYEIPELLALDQEAKQKGVLILNELGEVPGMDHLGTQLLEGTIQATGTRMPPTLPELYEPMLEELARFGFEFKRRTISL